jgi:hypothetical protein
VRGKESEGEEETFVVEVDAPSVGPRYTAADVAHATLDQVLWQ